MSFTIYPEPSSGRNFATFPILIFNVGTALTTITYKTVFEPIANDNDIIIYVLDTNPGSIPKTLEGFNNHVDQILDDIKGKFGISTTSNNIYLGGHSVGGIIGVNAVYPDNFNVTTSPLTINTLSFPVKGLVVFDSVDGDQPRSNQYPFRTKFDPDRVTHYVTPTGEVNPLSVLIFATAVENTGINPAYGGQRSYKAVGNSSNHPSNKYCFVSQGKYHHMDYTDPVTQAYRTDLTRALWTVKAQSDYVEGFQAFLRSKIVSFILSPSFDTTGFDDVHLLSH